MSEDIKQQFEFARKNKTKLFLLIASKYDINTKAKKNKIKRHLEKKSFTENVNKLSSRKKRQRKGQ